MAEESLPGFVSSSAASPIRAGPAVGSETSQDGVRAARDRGHQTLDQETDPPASGGTGAVHFYCLGSSSYFLHKNLLCAPLGAQQCCSAQVLKLPV